MNTGIIVSIAYLPSMALINNDIWDILTPLVLITAIPKIKEPTVLPSLIKSGIMNSQISIARNIRAGVLVGYQTLINWERTDKEFVSAVIEGNVQPQREKGFGAIAQRIMQYDEVKSPYLMSGAYDLMVLCEAKTLKELAQFVHSRLSVIEGVTGTSTHFMLKTYKYGGMIFEGGSDDRRQAVMP